MFLQDKVSAYICGGSLSNDSGVGFSAIFDQYVAYLENDAF